MQDNLTLSDHLPFISKVMAHFKTEREDMAQEGGAGGYRYQGKCPEALVLDPNKIVADRLVPPETNKSLGAAHGVHDVCQPGAG